MTSRLVAIDPGKATGFAAFDISGGVPVLLGSWELDIEEFYDMLESSLAHYQDDVEVVIESFKITPATGKLSDAPWSLENIGVTRFLCRKYGAKLTLQPPSRAKDFVPNDRLKALEIWHVGGEGHARDALRHGVLYMVEQHSWRPHNLLKSD